MSMTSSGTGLLVFSDDVAEDRSSWKNSAKLTGRRFIVQMEDEPKHIAKATQGSVLCTDLIVADFT